MNLTTILLGVHVLGASATLLVALALVHSAYIGAAPRMRAQARLLAGGVIFETVTGIQLAIASGTGVRAVCDSIALYVTVCAFALVYAHVRSASCASVPTLARAFVLLVSVPTLLTGGALLAGL